MRRRHDAALLHRVVEQGQRGGGAMRAAGFQAHFLQDGGHGIANRGRGRQGKIHNAERHIQPPGRFQRHELAHAGDVEGRALDRFRHFVKGPPPHAFQRNLDHAGAADAHVDGAIALADAMEGPRHKRIVLHRIAEHHQFRAAQAAFVCRPRGGLFDDVAHHAHRVHVNARARGTHVDGGTQVFGCAERLGNGFNQPPVGRGDALMHQRGIAADEIHASFPRGLVQRLRDFGRMADRAGNQRDRRHGDALVHDRHAEFRFNGAAHLHQVFRLAGDAVVHAHAQRALVVAHTGQQGNAHGDGAHVQLLVIDHLQRLQDFRGSDHGALSLLNLVHRFEDFAALNANLHVQPFPFVRQRLVQPVEIAMFAGYIRDQDHAEQAGHDGLRNVQNVHVIFVQDPRHVGDNALAVLAENANNGFFHFLHWILLSPLSPFINDGMPCARPFLPTVPPARPTRRRARRAFLSRGRGSR